MTKVFFTQYSAFPLPPPCPLSSYRRGKLSNMSQEQRAKQIITEYFLLKALRTIDDDIAIPMNISTAEYGKPYIPGFPYCFNISHSSDLLICGVSDAEIGADVQEKSEKTNIEGIIKRFYSADEQEYVLSSEDMCDAFTKIWTLKEAYIKALGTGGATPLESFSVLQPIEGYSFYHNIAGSYHYAICQKTPTFPENIKFEKIS